MSAFAVPFHCPYCADEDLRPHGEQKGAWECRGCQRAFKLNYLGLLAPDAAGAPDSVSIPDRHSVRTP